MMGTLAKITSQVGATPPAFFHELQTALRFSYTAPMRTAILGLLAFTLVACSTPVTPQFTEPEVTLTLPSRTASGSSASAVPPIPVGPGFTLRDFTIDFPSGWRLLTREKTEGTVEAYDLVDATGAKKANVQCPIREVGYEAWTFEQLPRAFIKNGLTYGATLWIGTPRDTANIGPLNILFLHRNDFDHWAEAYDHSCEIVSFNGAIDAQAMQKLGASVR
jgi:hypothetical protein